MNVTSFAQHGPKHKALISNIGALPDLDSPRQNHLLATLSDADYKRIAAQLDSVNFSAGQSLYENCSERQYVYFLTSASVSLLYMTQDGASAEIAVIGDEGMVGTALFMGGDVLQGRTVVKTSGYGYRLDKNVMKEEFRRCHALQHSVLRYIQALITQLSQTAACNRHHTIEQQFCRCLLSSIDRLPSNEVKMTQEFIANMLGVRRESITEAARKLQHAGLIHYSRGHITVTNRRGLEAEVCECYSVIKREYDCLLNKKLAA